MFSFLARVSIILVSMHIVSKIQIFIKYLVVYKHQQKALGICYCRKIYNKSNIILQLRYNCSFWVRSQYKRMQVSDKMTCQEDSGWPDSMCGHWSMLCPYNHIFKIQKICNFWKFQSLPCSFKPTIFFLWHLPKVHNYTNLI